jgi:hypothetical protein
MKNKRIIEGGLTVGYDTYFSGEFKLSQGPNAKVIEYFKEDNDHWYLNNSDHEWHINPIENTRHCDPPDGLQEIIDDVLIPNGIVINGTVWWNGDDEGDIGKIIVTDNVVKIYYGHIIYKDINGVPEPEV